MGLAFGLDGNARVCKRRHRALFSIPGVCADPAQTGVRTLPPSKAARPTLAFQEMQAKHLNEDIYYPAKADWRPITLTMYDIRVDGGSHPVFDWFKQAYLPSGQNGTDGTWTPSVDSGMLIPQVTLEAYDGCGNVVERWIFEVVWPQTITFGEVDMGSNDIMTCDVSLRYARAYLDSSISQ